MTQPALADVGAPARIHEASTGFAVRVEGFEGPFDLLLSLIARHKLELTALALHTVTDDFIRHIRAQGESWDLDETTQFLVIAAVLLDLKAARLLPGDDQADEEDLALLEARDLLFARLLQYRAFKDVSAEFGDRVNRAPRRLPRVVGLDPELADLLPEVVIGIGIQGLAEVAIRALEPKPVPTVEVDHLHAPLVSVAEQAAVLVRRLRKSGSATFRALVSDCPDPAHVVARFLALLDLYRDCAVALEQAGPLTDLVVRWIHPRDDDGTTGYLPGTPAPERVNEEANHG